MAVSLAFPCVLTGRETLLVDSVKKKVRALEPVAEELGVGDRLSTYGGRIEDLALERPKGFSVLTARALSSLGSLLELASPLLRKSGRLVCYKAQPTEEELEIAFGIMKPLGFELVCDDNHELRTVPRAVFSCSRKWQTPASRFLAASAWRSAIPLRPPISFRRAIRRTRSVDKVQNASSAPPGWPHAVPDKQGASRLGWSKELPASPPVCQKLANQEFLARLWIAAANSPTEYIMEQLSDGNALDGSPARFATA